MYRINIGLLCIALTTLMLELTLVRVFDVIWYSNMAYMVITLAMFCFGLSGIYSSLRPLPENVDVNKYLARLALLFSIFSIAILPALNWIPFNFDTLYTAPVKGILMFLVMYLFLIIPFFLAGLLFTTIFSAFSSKIQSLYCWDLTGAALGCLCLIPLLPPIGPGGILFVACALGLISSACFSVEKKWSIISLVLAAILIIFPFTKDDYIDFKDHISKRGVKQAREKNFIEDSYWDPISKIDVVNFGSMKHVAYDGGSQSTFIFPFDGDFKAMRDDVLHGRGYHFYGPPVWVSHFLKKDSGHEVLVIGAAGGSETKAALMFGASHVDAVEMVGHVLDIGKNKYSQYNGNIYNHEKVNAIKGEGRSFLRSTDKKYDIIQIYSNHTSSSIAAGTGAMATTYLQTVEAYKEYFSHLKGGGILHINHHIYPRMITTAARAWKEMGKKDFLRHVVVLEAAGSFQDNLPTMLIKESPWSEDEVEAVKSRFNKYTQVVVHPIHPETNMLPPVFFSGDMPQHLIDESHYRVEATTDDKPYFNFLRKKISTLQANNAEYLNYSTASLLNSQLKNGFIPSDVVHLIVTAIASLFFIVLFIFIPLFFSSAGRQKWQGKLTSLAYFSCLGSGFIIFELSFIQIFMKLIGYPLYTYSTVVFSLLLAAGLGSAASKKLNVLPEKSWALPFIGILICSISTLLGYNFWFELFLQTPTVIRVLAAIVLIFPLGFFLGMPFPLGILTIAKQPKGAIPWAWAMNGLFTVVGGLGSVLLSIFYGFKITLIVAIFLYIGAWLTFSKLRKAI